METQQITTNPIIAVVITASGSHHFISQPTADDLYQARNEDMVELDDGSAVKLSGVMEILPLEQYYEKFPEKKPSNYGQPYVAKPVEFSDDEKQYAIDYVKSKMAAEVYQPYHNLLEQIYNETKMNFEDDKFVAHLRSRNIITQNDAVLADLKLDNGDRTAYCYPAFCNMREAIERWQERKQWEDAHTLNFDDPQGFDKIINDAPLSGLTAMLRGLDKHLAESPMNTKAKVLREKMLKKLNENQNAAATKTPTVRPV